MKIRNTRMVHEDIDLNDQAVYDVTVNRLRQLLGDGEYLRTENGKVVVKQDDSGWRHGSVRENYVRDATELDISIFEVLDALRTERQIMVSKIR